MLLIVCLAAIGFLSALVQANTEKVIFTAPDTVNLGNARPGLLDLRLHTFTPDSLALRTALSVAFPTHEQPRGVQSWYLLQTLNPGQRYEVRVCWPATQPTQFWLETYKITHVLDNPSLIQDLAAYTDDRQSKLSGEAQEAIVQDTPSSQSALFLRIWSAADYYTTNQDLMQHPSLVDVDIILDSYILNIFPKSLLPTAVYIIVLAVPRHPFYNLPAELVLDIVDLLPPDAFVNFVFANYPLLREYGLAPALSSARVSYLVRQTRISVHFQLLPFPPEINLLVLSYFRPIDLMNFVMANYQHMAIQGIAPHLTPETIQQLRRLVALNLRGDDRNGPGQG